MAEINEETNQETILDAEELINGSTVSPPEDISFADTTPDISNELDAQVSIAGADALATQEQIAKDQALVDKEAELVTAREEEKGFLEKLMAGTEVTRAEKRVTAEEKEEVTAKEKLVSDQAIKVAGIQGRISVLEDKKQKEIDRAYDQPRGAAHTSVAIDAIERRYDSQKASLAAILSGEAALMNAYQGNLSMAESNVTDAINDYMYDYEQEVKRFEFVYDYHSDWVDSLEEDQKVLLDRAYKESQDAELNARDDLKYKQDLWTRAAEQGVYVPFSSLKDMTTEEAAKWYAEKVSARVSTQLGGELESELNQRIATVSGAISSGAGREDLLKSLEDDRTFLVNTYGQEGFNRIQAEIDRLSPAIEEKAPITPTEVGTGTGEFLRGFPGAVWGKAGEVTKAISEFNKSFFGGLLGK